MEPKGVFFFKETFNSLSANVILVRLDHGTKLSQCCHLLSFSCSHKFYFTFFCIVKSLFSFNTGLSIVYFVLVINVILLFYCCRCANLTLDDGTRYCEFAHNGKGVDYQIIAGPSFIAVYSIVGIFFGILADKYNR